MRKTKKLKRIVFHVSIFLFLFKVNTINSQSKEVDTLERINSFLKIEVNNSFKDLSKYRIIDGEKFLIKNEILADSISFEDFIITKSKLSLKGYCLYEVEIVNKITEANDNRFKKSYKTSSWNINNLLKGRILLAYSLNEILVLSGYIPNSIYSSMFDISLYKNKEQIKFLELKLFVFESKDILYQKKDNKWFYFTGNEILFTKKTRVFYKMNKKNPDLVKRIGLDIRGKKKIGIY